MAQRSFSVFNSHRPVRRHQPSRHDVIDCDEADRGAIDHNWNTFARMGVKAGRVSRGT